MPNNRGTVRRSWMNVWSGALCVAVILCALCGARAASLIVSPATSEKLRQKYLSITDGWAKDVVFTPAEARAMQQGRRWENLMTHGLDDPLARKIIEAGEPSYESVFSYYPGKILDRTILGSYSDPHSSVTASENEFVIWWNGAISANLLSGRFMTGPKTVRPVAENTNALFRVGRSAEMFGKFRSRYSSIGYEEGFLPIVDATYVCDGVRYQETALADNPASETRGWDIAYVRFKMTNVSGTPRTAKLSEDLILIDGTGVTASQQKILDASGAVLMTYSDARARFDAQRQRLTQEFDLKPGAVASVYLKIPYTPDSAGLIKTASQQDFDKAHSRLRQFWSHLLSTGIKLHVPEERVNNAWRALVLQEFVLADGPRFTYGSGLVYNSSYFPFEDGFATLTLTRYGFEGYADALLAYSVPPAVDRTLAGYRYQNRRAIPFHLIYENFRLTGKTDVFEKYKNVLYKTADEIVADRHRTMVEQNGSRPLSWGLLPPARPAVDARASNSANYVIAHDITNCQGLQDFGEFLVQSGIDPDRGRHYLLEAHDFRKTLRRAMEKSVIYAPGRPPFVPLQTLYFRQTPLYGPEPFDNLALGRVQGTYYHYWADMQFHYHFFNPDNEVARYIADYLQKMGGFVLGMTRGRLQPGSPYGWINDNYNAGYYDFALRRGDVERFLLGFYARLAYAMTRHVDVASEGAPFIGYNTRDGGFVSARYSFPNSAANAETLDLLRDMLVMEGLKDNLATGDIYLARGVPRAWLRDGDQIRVSDAPTYYGRLSYEIDSRVNSGVITALIQPPRRDKYHDIILTFRHPQSAPIRHVLVNGKEHHDFDPNQGWVRLAAGPSQFRVEAIYR